MRADTIPLASISQETNNVLISITNVYNCSQMLCKFRTKHLLTQNTPHFLSFRNILSIKVLQKTIQIQTKDNGKRPCHLHQITWQSAWGYNAIWCKQRCVLRQVTTHDERNCPPRTPKWNNSLCFPASFSLFWCSHEMLKTSNNLYWKAELSHDYIHVQHNKTKIQEHAEKPLFPYAFPCYSFLLENQLQSPFTLMYFSA